MSYTEVMGTLAVKVGWGNHKDVVDDVRDRFGDEPAQELATAVKDVWQARRQSLSGHSAFIDPLAEPMLRAMPVPFFLEAVRLSLASGRTGFSYGAPEAIQAINQLFEARGVYFRLDYSAVAEWVGDEQQYDTITRPALDVLADPRLLAARIDYEGARDHLRKRTNSDLEDAITDAARAVESVMKVLIDETNAGTRSGKEGANDLFGMLATAGTVEVEADQTVFGVGRIRNKWGGHGAGAVPRVVPFPLAEHCVNAAASAIVYLGGKLP